MSGIHLKEDLDEKKRLPRLAAAAGQVIGQVIGKGLEVVGEGMKFIPGLQGVGAAVNMTGLALEGVSGAPKALEAAQHDPIGQRVLRYGALTLKIIGTGVGLVVGGPVGGVVAGTLLFGGDIVDGGRKILQGEKNKDTKKTVVGAANVAIAGTGIGLLIATAAFPPAAVFTVPALLAVGGLQLIGMGASAIANFFDPSKKIPEMMSPVPAEVAMPKMVKPDGRHKSQTDLKPKVGNSVTFSAGRMDVVENTKPKGRTIVPTVFTFPEPAIKGKQEKNPQNQEGALLDWPGHRLGR